VPVQVPSVYTDASPEHRLSRRQTSFIDLAMRVATSCSDSPTFRHGAVLVTGGRIISACSNTWKTSSFSSRFRSPGTGIGTRHAEVSCILGIGRELTAGATVYVVRVNRKGLPRMSKPCSMCMKTMRFVGIKKVIYTTSSGISKMRL
jgi:tRNA(Arg) A34 adenosine deaminase TadA